MDSFSMFVQVDENIPTDYDDMMDYYGSDDQDDTDLYQDVPEIRWPQWSDTGW